MTKFKRIKDVTNTINFFRRGLAGVILFTFFLISIGCTGNKGLRVGDEIEMDRTTLSVSQIPYPFDLFPEYRILPGDVLDVLFQIRTWIERDEFKLNVDHTVAVKFPNSPELNEEQMIRPDGTITLPYLGSVHVTGKTVEELTLELKNRYNKILQDPDLYIIVPEFRSAIKELKADLHTAPRGLSRLVTVRPDGYVTFPMVGDIFVSRKTIPEINKILNEKYEVIVQGLHCDLFLERHSGTLIYVVGQVAKPGAYKIQKPITIIEALALSGSYIPGAKLDSVIVARKHENKIIATRVNIKENLTLKKGTKFLYLQPDDIVYVPKTWIATAAEVAQDIGNILFFRGWSVGFSYELHSEDNND